ncbi:MULTISPECIES: hypothetical protein [Haloarcula]|uniref:hypothetical protein n=1 Tax=Haloarcula TaxID=2237 RepID=UPI0023E8D6EE|nr:hypothetical protein [Halomicroarcula sp. SHR3]
MPCNDQTPDAVEVPFLRDNFFDNELGAWDPNQGEVGPRHGVFDPINHYGDVSVANQQLQLEAHGCYQAVAFQTIGEFTGDVHVRFDFERVPFGQEDNVHHTDVYILEDGDEANRDIVRDSTTGTGFEPEATGEASGSVTAEASVDGVVTVVFEVKPRPVFFNDGTACSFGAGGGTTLKIDSVEVGTVVENYSDTDGDGLPDSIELNGIPLGNGRTVETDPLDPDTDGDGLEDGEEILVDQFVTHPDNDAQYYLMNSDPTLLDSSGSGLSDYTERALGVDPLASNTDGDEFADHEDFDPLEPYEPNRLSDSERAAAFRDGVIRGDTGADGGIWESPYSDTPPYVAGHILGASIPYLGTAPTFGTWPQTSGKGTQSESRSPLPGSFRVPATRPERSVKSEISSDGTRTSTGG